MSDGSRGRASGSCGTGGPQRRQLCQEKAVESGYNPGARMNYYEELGLPNTASAEEVRRAYRSLARLLHPDQQPDETLRRLAGAQMTRLKQILETLTEPRLRV